MFASFTCWDVYIYACVNVGEPGEYDALVQGDAGDRGERAAPGAGD